MALTDDQLLDLEVMQRTGTFRFDVLDQNLNDAGELDVSAASTPTIDNDTDRDIKRTLSGLVLSAATANAINPQRDRVRVSYVLSSGVRRSMGVFVFTDNSRQRNSWGSVPAPQMSDLGVALKQPAAETFSVAPGTFYVDAIAAALLVVGVEAVIEPSDSRTSGTTAQGWPAGTDWLEILNALASSAGFASPYFDNAGVLRFRSLPDVAVTDLSYTLGPTSRVIDGSIVESDSSLDAPNRYLAIDTTNTDAPVVGIFDVPDSAPHSAVNIGYVRTQRIDAQGAGTPEQCEAIAVARYRADRQYEWITFASPPDPRHDTYQTVRFDGVVFRETGWKLPCSEGAAMEHELRRTYT